MSSRSVQPSRCRRLEGYCAAASASSILVVYDPVSIACIAEDDTACCLTMGPKGPHEFQMGSGNRTLPVEPMKRISTSCAFRHAYQTRKFQLTISLRSKPDWYTLHLFFQTHLGKSCAAASLPAPSLLPLPLILRMIPMTRPTPPPPSPGFSAPTRDLFSGHRFGGRLGRFGTHGCGDHAGSAGRGWMTIPL